MEPLDTLATGFCPYCGRRVGADGCPDHPNASVHGRSEAGTLALLHDGHRASVDELSPRPAGTAVIGTAPGSSEALAPVPTEPTTHNRIRTPGRRPWLAVTAVVAIVALAATVGAQAARVQSQSDRLDALAHRLDAQASAQASARQQLTAAAGEVETANQRLTNLEGKQADTLDTTAVSAKVVNSVFTVRTSYGLGSGFAFKADGANTLLVTNFHVVADDYNAGVRTVDVVRGDETFPGTVVAVDKTRDLAAIRVPLHVPVIATATGAVKVGQPVLVVGAPLGLGQTVTNGVVSALRDGQIQFSAPVSPGNSGGPVVDANGDVVGVTEAKVEAVGVEGLAFAIPITNVCKKVITC